MMYRAIYKDRYEYTFRISKEKPDHFEYMTWDKKWVLVDKILDYKENSFWEIVAIH